MQANLGGKVVLATGSTYGIGKAIALKLAENGAAVAINGRNPEVGLRVVDELTEAGYRAIFERADITDYTEVKHMVTNVIQRLGKIDILVASGGVIGQLLPNYFHEIPPESYLGLAKAGWLSRLYCIRAVLDHMIERQAGKIILLIGDAGRVPTPGVSMTGGAHAALVMMTKVLASEFSRWQIRVNGLSMSIVLGTESLQWALESPSAKMYKKALERQSFPVNASDIAEAALFLASDESNPITGQILSINGGLSFPG